MMVYAAWTFPGWVFDEPHATLRVDQSSGHWSQRFELATCRPTEGIYVYEAILRHADGEVRKLFITYTDVQRLRRHMIREQVRVAHERTTAHTVRQLNPQQLAQLALLEEPRPMNDQEQDWDQPHCARCGQPLDPAKLNSYPGSETDGLYCDGQCYAKDHPEPEEEDA